MGMALPRQPKKAESRLCRPGPSFDQYSGTVKPLTSVAYRQERAFFLPATASELPCGISFLCPLMVPQAMLRTFHFGR